MTQSEQGRRSGDSFFGRSLGGFGLLTSVLLTVATGFCMFFLTTFLSILALLLWNTIGGHQVNYADSYLYVGLPAGGIALFVAAFVLGTLWLRSKMR
jgi:hypothetical protein